MPVSTKSAKARSVASQGAVMQSNGEVKKLNGKEKKLRRKQELEEAKALQGIIKAASGRGVLLEEYPAFKTFKKNGVELQLEYTTAEGLSSDMKVYMQNLLKDNMAIHYGEAWAKQEKIKARELTEPDAHYILLRQALSIPQPVQTSEAAEARSAGDHVRELTGNVTACYPPAESVERSSSDGGSKQGTSSEWMPRMQEPVGQCGTGIAGFVHFRFVEEEALPVLYVYELQLEPSVRRLGLGKFLMQFLEFLARKSNMKGCVLTVQKQNAAAMDFYLKKLKYVYYNPQRSALNDNGPVGFCFRPQEFATGGESFARLSLRCRPPGKMSDGPSANFDFWLSFSGATNGCFQTLISGFSGSGSSVQQHVASSLSSPFLFLSISFLTPLRKLGLLPGSHHGKAQFME